MFLFQVDGTGGGSGRNRPTVDTSSPSVHPQTTTLTQENLSTSRRATPHPQASGVVQNAGAQLRNIQGQNQTQNPNFSLQNLAAQTPLYQQSSMRTLGPSRESNYSVTELMQKLRTAPNQERRQFVMRQIRARVEPQIHSASTGRDSIRRGTLNLVEDGILHDRNFDPTQMQGLERLLHWANGRERETRVVTGGRERAENLWQAYESYQLAHEPPHAANVLNQLAQELRSHSRPGAEGGDQQLSAADRNALLIRVIRAKVGLRNFEGINFHMGDLRANIQQEWARGSVEGRWEAHALLTEYTQLRREIRQNTSAAVFNTLMIDDPHPADESLRTHLPAHMNLSAMTQSLQTENSQTANISARVAHHLQLSRAHAAMENQVDALSSVGEAEDILRRDHQPDALIRGVVLQAYHQAHLDEYISGRVQGWLQADERQGQHQTPQHRYEMLQNWASLASGLEEVGASAPAHEVMSRVQAQVGRFSVSAQASLYNQLFDDLARIQNGHGLSDELKNTVLTSLHDQLSNPHSSFRDHIAVRELLIGHSRNTAWIHESVLDLQSIANTRVSEDRELLPLQATMIRGLLRERGILEQGRNERQARGEDVQADYRQADTLTTQARHLIAEYRSNLISAREGLSDPHSSLNREGHGAEIINSHYQQLIALSVDVNSSFVNDDLQEQLSFARGERVPERAPDFRAQTIYSEYQNFLNDLPAPQRVEGLVQTMQGLAERGDATRLRDVFVPMLQQTLSGLPENLRARALIQLSPSLSELRQRLETQAERTRPGYGNTAANEVLQGRDEVAHLEESLWNDLRTHSESPAIQQFANSMIEMTRGHSESSRLILQTLLQNSSALNASDPSTQMILQVARSAIGGDVQARTERILRVIDGLASAREAAWTAEGHTGEMAAIHHIRQDLPRFLSTLPYNRLPQTFEEALRLYSEASPENARWAHQFEGAISRIPLQHIGRDGHREGSVWNLIRALDHMESPENIRNALSQLREVVHDDISWDTMSEEGRGDLQIPLQDVAAMLLDATPHSETSLRNEIAQLQHEIPGLEEYGHWKRETFNYRTALECAMMAAAGYGAGIVAAEIVGGLFTEEAAALSARALASSMLGEGAAAEEISMMAQIVGPRFGFQAGQYVTRTLVHSLAFNTFNSVTPMMLGQNSEGNLGRSSLDMAADTAINNLLMMPIAGSLPVPRSMLGRILLGTMHHAQMAATFRIAQNIRYQSVLQTARLTSHYQSLENRLTEMERLYRVTGNATYQTRAEEVRREIEHISGHPPDNSLHSLLGDFLRNVGQGVAEHSMGLSHAQGAHEQRSPEEITRMREATVEASVRARHEREADHLFGPHGERRVEIERAGRERFAEGGVEARRIRDSVRSEVEAEVEREGIPHEGTYRGVDRESYVRSRTEERYHARLEGDRESWMRGREVEARTNYVENHPERNQESLFFHSLAEQGVFEHFNPSQVTAVLSQAERVRPSSERNASHPFPLRSEANRSYVRSLFENIHPENLNRHALNSTQALRSAQAAADLIHLPSVAGERSPENLRAADHFLRTAPTESLRNPERFISQVQEAQATLQNPSLQARLSGLTADQALIVLLHSDLHESSGGIVRREISLAESAQQLLRGELRLRPRSEQERARVSSEVWNSREALAADQQFIAERVPENERPPAPREHRGVALTPGQTAVMPGYNLSTRTPRPQSPLYSFGLSPNITHQESGRTERPVSESLGFTNEVSEGRDERGGGNERGSEGDTQGQARDGNQEGQHEQNQEGRPGHVPQADAQSGIHLNVGASLPSTELRTGAAPESGVNASGTRPGSDARHQPRAEGMGEIPGLEVGAHGRAPLQQEQAFAGHVNEGAVRIEGPAPEILQAGEKDPNKTTIGGPPRTNSSAPEEVTIPRDDASTRRPPNIQLIDQTAEACVDLMNHMGEIDMSSALAAVERMAARMETSDRSLSERVRADLAIARDHTREGSVEILDAIQRLNGELERIQNLAREFQNQAANAPAPEPSVGATAPAIPRRMANTHSLSERIASIPDLPPAVQTLLRERLEALPPEERNQPLSDAEFASRHLVERMRGLLQRGGLAAAAPLVEWMRAQQTTRTPLAEHLAEALAIHEQFSAAENSARVEGVETPAPIAALTRDAAWAKAQRVLVVDDDPLVSRTFVRGIKGNHPNVEAVASGQEALDHVAANPDVAIITMDYTMPGMNGLEAARRLRAQGFRGPILFITGDSNPPGVEEISNSRVLHKPLTGATISQNIVEALTAAPTPEAVAPVTETHTAPRMSEVSQFNARVLAGDVTALFEGDGVFYVETLGNESMGGNAGDSHLGLNAHLDLHTGRMITVGNGQFTESARPADAVAVTFRVWLPLASMSHIRLAMEYEASQRGGASLPADFTARAIQITRESMRNRGIPQSLHPIFENLLREVERDPSRVGELFQARVAEVINGGVHQESLAALVGTAVNTPPEFSAREGNVIDGRARDVLPPTTIEREMAVHPNVPEVLRRAVRIVSETRVFLTALGNHFSDSIRALNAVRERAGDSRRQVNLDRRQGRLQSEMTEPLAMARVFDSVFESGVERHFSEFESFTRADQPEQTVEQINYFLQEAVDRSTEGHEYSQLEDFRHAVLGLKDFIDTLSEVGRDLDASGREGMANHLLAERSLMGMRYEGIRNLLNTPGVNVALLQRLGLNMPLPTLGELRRRMLNPEQAGESGRANTRGTNTAFASPHMMDEHIPGLDHPDSMDPTARARERVEGTRSGLASIDSGQRDGGSTPIPHPMDAAQVIVRNRNREGQQFFIFRSSEDIPENPISSEQVHVMSVETEGDHHVVRLRRANREEVSIEVDRELPIHVGETFHFVELEHPGNVEAAAVRNIPAAEVRTLEQSVANVEWIQANGFMTSFLLRHLPVMPMVYALMSRGVSFETIQRAMARVGIRLGSLASNERMPAFRSLHDRNSTLFAGRGAYRRAGMTQPVEAPSEAVVNGVQTLTNLISVLRGSPLQHILNRATRSEQGARGLSILMQPAVLQHLGDVLRQSGVRAPRRVTLALIEQVMSHAQSPEHAQELLNQYSVYFNSIREGVNRWAQSLAAEAHQHDGYKDSVVDLLPSQSTIANLLADHFLEALVYNGASMEDANNILNGMNDRSLVIGNRYIQSIDRHVFSAQAAETTLVHGYVKNRVFQFLMLEPHPGLEFADQVAFARAVFDTLPPQEVDRFYAHVREVNSPSWFSTPMFQVLLERRGNVADGVWRDHISHLREYLQSPVCSEAERARIHLLVSNLLPRVLTDPALASQGILLSDMSVMIRSLFESGVTPLVRERCLEIIPHLETGSVEAGVWRELLERHRETDTSPFRARIDIALDRLGQTVPGEAVSDTPADTPTTTRIRVETPHQEAERLHNEQAEREVGAIHESPVQGTAPPERARARRRSDPGNGQAGFSTEGPLGTIGGGTMGFGLGVLGLKMGLGLAGAALFIPAVLVGVAGAVAAVAGLSALNRIQAPRAPVANRDHFSFENFAQGLVPLETRHDEGPWTLRLREVNWNPESRTLSMRVVDPETVEMMIREKATAGGMEVSSPRPGELRIHRPGTRESYTVRMEEIVSRANVPRVALLDHPNVSGTMRLLAHSYARASGRSVEEHYNEWRQLLELADRSIMHHFANNLPFSTELTRARQMMEQLGTLVSGREGMRQEEFEQTVSQVLQGLESVRAHLTVPEEALAVEVLPPSLSLEHQALLHRVEAHPDEPSAAQLYSLFSQARNHLEISEHPHFESLVQALVEQARFEMRQDVDSARGASLEKHFNGFLRSNGRNENGQRVENQNTESAPINLVNEIPAEQTMERRRELARNVNADPRAAERILQVSVADRNELLRQIRHGEIRSVEDAIAFLDHPERTLEVRDEDLLPSVAEVYVDARVQHRLENLAEEERAGFVARLRSGEITTVEAATTYLERRQASIPSDLRPVYNEIAHLTRGESEPFSAYAARTLREISNFDPTSLLYRARITEYVTERNRLARMIIPEYGRAISDLRNHFGNLRLRSQQNPDSFPFHVVRVDARLKDPTDIAAKITRRGYHDMNEFFDLGAARVIVRNRTEAEALIPELMRWAHENGYQILPQEIEHKHSPSGYRAIHVNLRRNGQPVAEVQIHTPAMEAWGRVEHQLIYKNPALDVPIIGRLQRTYRQVLSDYCAAASNYLIAHENGEQNVVRPRRPLENILNSLPEQTRHPVNEGVRQMEALMDRISPPVSIHEREAAPMQVAARGPEPLGTANTPGATRANISSEMAGPFDVVADAAGPSPLERRMRHEPNLGIIPDAGGRIGGERANPPLDVEAAARGADPVLAANRPRSVLPHKERPLFMGSNLEPANHSFVRLPEVAQRFSGSRVEAVSAPVQVNAHWTVPAHHAVVSEAWVEAYCQASGLPVRRDVQGRVMLPAGLSFVMAHPAIIEALYSALGRRDLALIHGSETIEHYRPILAGEEVRVEVSVGTVRGNNAIVTRRLFSVRTGELLLKADSNFTARESLEVPVLTPSTSGEAPVISQGEIRGYAEASGDHQSIHLEQGIVHGMLLFNRADAQMPDTNPPCRLRMTFKAPLRAGETVHHENSGRNTLFRNAQGGDVAFMMRAPIVIPAEAVVAQAAHTSDPIGTENSPRAHLASERLEPTPNAGERIAGETESPTGAARTADPLSDIGRPSMRLSDLLHEEEVSEDVSEAFRPTLLPPVRFSPQGESWRAQHLNPILRSGQTIPEQAQAIVNTIINMSHATAEHYQMGIEAIRSLAGLDPTVRVNQLIELMQHPEVPLEDVERFLNEVDRMPHLSARTRSEAHYMIQINHDLYRRQRVMQIFAEYQRLASGDAVLSQALDSWEHSEPRIGSLIPHLLAAYAREEMVAQGLTPDISWFTPQYGFHTCEAYPSEMVPLEVLRDFVRAAVSFHRTGQGQFTNRDPLYPFLLVPAHGQMHFFLGQRPNLVDALRNITHNMRAYPQVMGALGGPLFHNKVRLQSRMGNDGEPVFLRMERGRYEYDTGMEMTLSGTDDLLRPDSFFAKAGIHFQTAEDGSVVLRVVNLQGAYRDEKAPHPFEQEAYRELFGNVNATRLLMANVFAFAQSLRERGVRVSRVDVIREEAQMGYRDLLSYNPHRNGERRMSPYEDFARRFGFVSDRTQPDYVSLPLPQSPDEMVALINRGLGDEAAGNFWSHILPAMDQVATVRARIPRGTTPLGARPFHSPTFQRLGQRGLAHLEGERVRVREQAQSRANERHTRSIETDQASAARNHRWRLEHPGQNPQATIVSLGRVQTPDANIAQSYHQFIEAHLRAQGYTAERRGEGNTYEIRISREGQEVATLRRMFAADNGCKRMTWVENHGDPEVVAAVLNHEAEFARSNRMYVDANFTRHPEQQQVFERHYPGSITGLARSRAFALAGTPLEDNGVRNRPNTPVRRTVNAERSQPTQHAASLQMLGPDGLTFLPPTSAPDPIAHLNQTGAREVTVCIDFETNSIVLNASSPNHQPLFRVVRENNGYRVLPHVPARGERMPIYRGGDEHIRIPDRGEVLTPGEHGIRIGVLMRVNLQIPEIENVSETEYDQAARTTDDMATTGAHPPRFSEIEAPDSTPTSEGLFSRIHLPQHAPSIVAGLGAIFTYGREALGEALSAQEAAVAMGAGALVLIGTAAVAVAVALKLRSNNQRSNPPLPRVNNLQQVPVQSRQRVEMPAVQMPVHPAPVDRRTQPFESHLASQSNPILTEEINAAQTGRRAINMDRLINEVLIPQVQEHFAEAGDFASLVTQGIDPRHIVGEDAIGHYQYSNVAGQRVTTMLVSDGMGGMGNGDVAAQLSLSAFHAELRRSGDEDRAWALANAAVVYFNNVKQQTNDPVEARRRAEEFIQRGEVPAGLQVVPRGSGACAVSFSVVAPLVAGMPHVLHTRFAGDAAARVFRKDPQGNWRRIYATREEGLGAIQADIQQVSSGRTMMIRLNESANVVTNGLGTKNFRLRHTQDGEVPVSENEVRVAREYENGIALQEGDLVLAGSDGLWENFFSSDEVAQLIRHCESSGAAVRVLSVEAHRRMEVVRQLTAGLLPACPENPQRRMFERDGVTYYIDSNRRVYGSPHAQQPLTVFKADNFSLAAYLHSPTRQAAFQSRPGRNADATMMIDPRGNRNNVSDDAATLPLQTRSAPTRIMASPVVHVVHGTRVDTASLQALPVNQTYVLSVLGRDSTQLGRTPEGHLVVRDLGPFRTWIQRANQRNFERPQPGVDCNLQPGDTLILGSSPQETQAQRFQVRWVDNAWLLVNLSDSSQAQAARSDVDDLGRRPPRH